MKALILAAGFGSRLRPITDNVPKALVPVNGTPIIIKQISNLLENNITDITVISGYKSNVLSQALLDFYPSISIIESVDYETTNNMYSAYLGKVSVADSDFLMMNADVFCDSSVIKSLIDFPNPDSIAVDIGNFIEESMKVVESNGSLIEISKQITKEKALGSSIDIYKFSAEIGKIFFEKCAEYINSGDVRKWSEVALNDILPICNFKACPVSGRWYEIDDFNDLKNAEIMFEN